MKCNKPITGKPNGRDDDTIDRGVTGQSLRDKSMNYSPSNGQSHGADVNLNVQGENESYAHEGMEND